MEIPGYKYITHKIIPRQWGIECRFTVGKDGRHFNDIVMLETGKEDDKALVDMILARLALVDRSAEPEIEPERTYTEAEVKNLLVEKGYLMKTQTVVDLKTKAELIAEVNR